MQENYAKSIIIASIMGVLTGGAVGFALGLLAAPAEGQKTRRTLAFHLDRLGHNVADLMERLGRAEEASEARRTGDALVEDARQQANKILSDADALLEEVKRYRKVRRPSL